MADLVVIDQEAARVPVQLKRRAKTSTHCNLGALNCLQLRQGWAFLSSADRALIDLTKRTLELAWPVCIRASDDELRFARRTSDPSAKYPYAFYPDSQRTKRGTVIAGRPRPNYHYLWHDLGSRQAVSEYLKSSVTTTLHVKHEKSSGSLGQSNAYAATPASIGSLNHRLLFAPADPDSDYEPDGPVSSRIRGLDPDVVPSIEFDEEPDTPARRTRSQTGSSVGRPAYSPRVVIETRAHHNDDSELESLRSRSGSQSPLVVSKPCSKTPVLVSLAAPSGSTPRRRRRAVTEPPRPRRKDIVSVSPLVDSGYASQCDPPESPASEEAQDCDAASSGATPVSPSKAKCSRSKAANQACNPKVSVSADDIAEREARAARKAAGKKKAYAQASAKMLDLLTQAEERLLTDLRKSKDNKRLTQALNRCQRDLRFLKGSKFTLRLAGHKDGWKRTKSLLKKEVLMLKKRIAKVAAASVSATSPPATTSPSPAASAAPVASAVSVASAALVASSPPVASPAPVAPASRAATTAPSARPVPTATCVPIASAVPTEPRAMRAANSTAAAQVHNPPTTRCETRKIANRPQLDQLAKAQTRTEPHGEHNEINLTPAALREHDIMLQYSDPCPWDIFPVLEHLPSSNTTADVACASQVSTTRNAKKRKNEHGPPVADRPLKRQNLPDVYFYADGTPRSKKSIQNAKYRAGKARREAEALASSEPSFSSDVDHARSSSNHFVSSTAVPSVPLHTTSTTRRPSTSNNAMADNYRPCTDSSSTFYRSFPPYRRQSFAAQPARTYYADHDYQRGRPTSSYHESAPRHQRFDSDNIRQRDVQHVRAQPTRHAVHHRAHAGYQQARDRTPWVSKTRGHGAGMSSAVQSIVDTFAEATPEKARKMQAMLELVAMM